MSGRLSVGRVWEQHTCRVLVPERLRQALSKPSGNIHRYSIAYQLPLLSLQSRELRSPFHFSIISASRRSVCSIWQADIRRLCLFLNQQEVSLRFVLCKTCGWARQAAYSMSAGIYDNMNMLSWIEGVLKGSTSRLATCWSVCVGAL